VSYARHEHRRTERHGPRHGRENRGILAADESTSTIKKRFDTIKLESTEENRAPTARLLFTAPGAAEYISGVIMYDETLRQKTKDGVPLATYLTQHGMLPGIKVDMGAKPLAGFPGETITEAWTDCASGSRSTTRSGRDSRSGARSSISAAAFPPPMPSTRTPEALAR